MAVFIKRCTHQTLSLPSLPRLPILSSYLLWSDMTKAGLPDDGLWQCQGSDRGQEKSRRRGRRGGGGLDGEKEEVGRRST